MPYNGSGTFSRIYSWIADRNANIKIRADRMDAEMDGFATGLSNTITKDGQTTVTADIPFNAKKITGLGDATAATDALNRQSGDARYKWFTIADQTLASATNEFSSIALGTCSRLRLSLVIRPNASAASDFQTLWRLSTDGGSTFPSGASDYGNQSDTGAGSSAGAAASNNSAGFLSATISKTSAIPGRVNAEFEKGSANYRASMLSKAYFFNGTASQVYDVGSSYSTLGTATHLQIFGDVASCFGIGSRLVVEGLV